MPPHLAGVKVGEREQVLQVEEPVGLRLLQHDHGVRLPEERTSGAHLPHLNELHHHLAERGSRRSSRADASERDGRGGWRATNLLIEIDQYVVGQFERLDGQQDRVPVAALDVGDEAVDALHRVERQSCLLLQSAQRAVEVVLLQVLHDQADHAGGEQDALQGGGSSESQHARRGD